MLIWSAELNWMLCHNFCVDSQTNCHMSNMASDQCLLCFLLIDMIIIRKRHKLPDAIKTNQHGKWFSTTLFEKYKPVFTEAAR